MRPLFLEFQDDENTREIWDQIMIGESLMMAPVLEAGIDRRRIYFPEGLWFNWWDHVGFQGPGWFDVPVRADELPLFVRGGHPLTTGPELQYVPENHRFDDISIHIFPPYQGDALIYEDDGQSLDYAGNGTSMQRFGFRNTVDGGRVRFDMPAAQGAFSGRPRHRVIHLHFYEAGMPESVLVNGTTASSQSGPLPFWHFDREKDCIVVHCRFPTAEPSSVEVYFPGDQVVDGTI